MVAEATTPRFRLIKGETVPLTRELVAELRSLPQSPTERQLFPKRVQFLKDRLLAGLFHPPYWVKAVVDGVTYRANGQHSSEMLMNADGDFPEGLVAHVDTFECTDIQALALLFRQFDDRKSARTPSDVAAAYQGLEDDLDEVPKSIAKLGVEGIAWYRRYVRLHQNTPNGDDVYTLFNEDQEHDFLKWLGDLFPTGKVNSLMKPAIFAAMYSTYNVDKDAADDFWREVASGGRDYEEEYPTTVLADEYKRVHDREFKITPRKMYQGAIYAWNALRNGKNIRDIRWDIKRNLMAPV